MEEQLGTGIFVCVICNAVSQSGSVTVQEFDENMTVQGASVGIRRTKRSMLGKCFYWLCSGLM